MKKSSTIKSVPIALLILVMLMMTLPGCFFGDKYKIESPKVHNPKETSNACAKSLGLNEKDMEQLSRVLKKNNNKFDDIFKLDAIMIITESDSVSTEDSDNVEKAYFSCIEESTSKKAP